MINTFMFLVRYTQTNINHLPYKTTHYYRIGGEALRFRQNKVELSLKKDILLYTQIT